mgnify:CR=1 FL=1
MRTPGLILNQTRHTLLNIVVAKHVFFTLNIFSLEECEEFAHPKLETNQKLVLFMFYSSCAKEALPGSRDFFQKPLPFLFLDVKVVLYFDIFPHCDYIDHVDFMYPMDIIALTTTKELATMKLYYKSPNNSSLSDTTRKMVIHY